MATNTDMTALDGAARFVRQFGEVWQQPSVQRLDELTHDDVEYVQPLHRTITGREAAADFWRQMLAMIPDLRAEVLNWAHREGAVYVEFRMSGTIAGNPITWEAVDRYRLEDGKVRQRIAYLIRSRLQARLRAGHEVSSPSSGSARVKPLGGTHRD